MRPEDLKQLILSDEAAAKLMDANDDFASAERCNAIAPLVRRVVPNIEIKRHAILNGYWANVTIAAEVENTNLQLRGLAISVGEWVNDSDASTDFELLEVQSMLGGLVAFGLMTSEQSANLVALSFARQVITQQQVEFARTRI